METINNVATQAAKAVWGSGSANKEPVSGVKGDVAKGEPYDAGNLDPEEQKKVESRLGDGAASRPQTADKPADKTESSPAPADTTSGQNDTANPNDANDDDPKVDVSGPGPRPLADVAREHGGDAGQDHKEEAKDQQQQQKKADEEEPAEKPKDSGTGEQHVKAIGFAADGGDFDASKPGAGEEADRLLEQKGVHRDDQAPAKSPATDSAASPSGEANGSQDSKSRDSKGRRSLSERIKAKFHKR